MKKVDTIFFWIANRIPWRQAGALAFGLFLVAAFAVVIQAVKAVTPTNRPRNNTQASVTKVSTLVTRRAEASVLPTPTDTIVGEEIVVDITPLPAPEHSRIVSPSKSDKRRAKPATDEYKDAVLKLKLLGVWKVVSVTKTSFYLVDKTGTRIELPRKDKGISRVVKVGDSHYNCAMLAFRGEKSSWCPDL